MADPISLITGLLALATFAFQSSIALYDTVQSYQNHPKIVRELSEEVKALSDVLHLLTDTISGTTGIDLSALELPLQRCGNACRDFEKEIIKCSSHSEKDRTSFRDWAKLKYMGYNIDGFRQLLAGYKSTINIALTDASLRKSALTADRIELYRESIKTATEDLEEQLQSIDGKIDILLGRTPMEPGLDTSQLDLVKEERLSIQKCLQICAQLSEHIDQVRSMGPQQRGSSRGHIDRETIPERFTNEGLQECKKTLNLTSAKLEQLMEGVIDQLVTKSKTAMVSDDDIADLCRLRETWQTSRQCRDICSIADTNLKENVSVIDNFASGDDTVQFLVSTDSKTIHGKNRGYGRGTRQFGGHINDESFQQLSRDFSSICFSELGNGSQSSRGKTTSVPGDATGTENNPGFRERYGQGFKLNPKPTPETSTSAGRAPKDV